MALPQIAGEFRIVGDPELNFGKSGTAVWRARIVASSRKQVDGKWVDDQTYWGTVKVFKDMAQHCSDSLRDKDVVTIVGREVTEEWQNADGQKRTSQVIYADSIGPGLRFRPAPHSDQRGPQEGPRTGGATPPQQQAAQAPQQGAQDAWGDPAF